MVVEFCPDWFVGGPLKLRCFRAQKRHTGQNDNRKCLIGEVAEWSKALDWNSASL